MPENPPPPEPEEKKPAPSAVLSGLAQILKWTIEPSKEGSGTALHLSLELKDFTDVVAILRIAKAGTVTLHMVALMYQLPLGGEVGCEHPEGKRLSFSPTQSVCLDCGLVIIPPKEEGEGPPESPTPPEAKE